MNIELKKIKHYPALSEETNAFSADIYADGKKIGSAKNDGQGGQTFLSMDHGAKTLFEAAENYCKGLPAVYVEGITEPLPMDLTFFLDNLLETHLINKERERAKRQISRMCETQILLVEKKELDDFESGKTASLSARKLVYKRPLISFDPAKLKNEIERIKREVLKPQEVILNDLSFVDMLYNPLHEISVSASTDWDKLREHQKANFEHLKSIDQKAKDAGKVLYRYFTIPVADGKAFYQVVGVSGKTAEIKGCQGISADDYVDPLLGESSTIPLHKATILVKQKDVLRELFAKKNE